MKEFSAIDLTGQAPEVICRNCSKHGIFHDPTQTTIIYCEHTLRGAFMALDQPWKIIAGIERSHFITMVKIGLTKGELRVDVARGLAEIVQDQARDATKH